MYKIINKKKLLATKIVDLVGSVIFFPWALFKKNARIHAEAINEILVIRTAYIGDVVMTLPLLKPLKELYPHARITFLTSSRACDIFENNPYVHEVLAYDAFWFYPVRMKNAIMDYFRFLKVLRSKRYDLVIDARADIRDIFFLVFMCKSRFRVSYGVGGGAYLLTHVVPFRKIKHKVEYHVDIARYLGAKVQSIDWGIYLDSEEKKAVDALLLQEGINRNDVLIGIHPGSRKELKAWEPCNFAKLADILIDEFGVKIVFTGSLQERGLVNRILAKMGHDAYDLTGKTDLRLLSGIIGRLNLFVCNDSAPLHIASVMKTPTVAIFGPSKSIETGPYGNVHKVVEMDFPCRYRCDEDVCMYEQENACMKAMHIDDVFSAVKTVYENTMPDVSLRR